MVHNIFKIFIILFMSHCFAHASSDHVDKNFESDSINLLIDSDNNSNEKANQETSTFLDDFVQKYESSVKKSSLIHVVGAIDPYIILQVDAIVDGNFSVATAVAKNLYELQTSCDHGDKILYYCVAGQDADGKLRQISDWHAGQDFKDKTTWTIFTLNKNIQEIIL